MQKFIINCKTKRQTTLNGKNNAFRPGTVTSIVDQNMISVFTLFCADSMKFRSWRSGILQV